MEQKKKALGRGLEQLFSSEVLDFDQFETSIMENANESDIKNLSLDEIRSNPYQPRKSFSEESLRELAESIKNYGVFQPIIVKKSIKGYELIAGERRVRASRMVGLDTIPAIVKDFSDEEMREIALLENLQRENLTGIELAWAYKGIIDNLHISQEELADKIGKSRSNVTNTLGLLRLPEEIQNEILENKISAGHAKILSKIDDNDKIREFADKIINEGISVRQLEELARGKDVKKKVPINRKSRTNGYDYIQSELREMFDTRVNVKEKKIEIFFDNPEQLSKILEAMNLQINK